MTVCDPKQLSPYADEEDLAPNIRACVPQEWKREACLTVAEASEWNVAKEGKVLISITEPAQSDFLLRQAQASTAEHQLAFLSESGSIEDAATAMDLSEAAIIAGQKNDFQRLATAIPLDIARLSGPFADVWHRRRAAWLNYARIDSDEKMLWENEIAWRLALAYEMRSLPKQEQPQQYVQQMQRLLPIDNAHAVWDGVIRDKRGRTPAHLFLLSAWPWNLAEACLKNLAAAKADFSIKDDQGKTPLHYLAAMGRQRPLFFIRGIDQIFVDAKVDFQVKDNEGNTPAIIAAKTETKDVLDWLVKQGADLDTTNNQGETARLLMAHNKDSFRSGPGNAETDIFQAAREGNIDAATRLLKADPSLINHTNQYQQTPLRLAVTQHQTNMTGFLKSHGAIWDAGSAVLADRTNELEKILKQDPQAAGMKIFGKGLLHIAAANNNLNTAQLLVAADADVNTVDNSGVSPLGYALIKHHKDIEEFLRQHGAKANVFDAVYADDLNTLATLLKQDKSLANASIREHLSAVSVAVAAGRTNILRALLKYGASVSNDHTELAAYYNQPGCLALLIRAGAKLDTIDRNGFAPLHWAAISGSTEAAELLLKHKVDINQAMVEVDVRQERMMGPDWGTIAGDTPLHFAALCGETNMVALLLKSGADVNAANSAKMTPLDLANSMRQPSFSIGIIQRSMTGLLSPLDDQQNPVAKMQVKMAGRKAAAEMIKASGGKQSSNQPPFGRTF